MKNKTKGLLFQLPATIIIVASVVMAFLIKLVPSLRAQYPLGWSPAITLLVIAILYFVGMYYSRKQDNPYY